MNNKRKEFEERLRKSSLSEEQKERYRKFYWELLRLRIMNGIAKVSRWAEKIKPLVAVSAKNEKVVFGGTADNVCKKIVSNVPAEANILTSLASDKVILESLECNLTRLCVFTAYLPNSDGNPSLPELSTLNVLRLIPENIPVGRAEYFEVRFNSDKLENEYDEILQAHKVKVMLYAPVANPLKRAMERVRELPSESKKSEKKNQSSPLGLKQSREEPEKRKPHRYVPQRQG